MGVVNQVSAQDTLVYPIQNSQDPTQTKPQSFDLGEPSSMKQTIVYDPSTGTYVFKETIGNSEVPYRNPSMMTLEEYLEYEESKTREVNWKERIDEQTAESRPFELPITVGSKLFENFFGSDQITIRPAGSIELSFGVNSSRYDNPILPVNQRKITRFDFQQQIQLSLVGQIGTKLKIGTSYNTQASFSFDNISKLEYSGSEDQIMQKIALGNVSMPLPTTLIQGSQTLFGAHTTLKFGRATVDLIAASSKGKRQEINIAGKSQIKEFELGADNYEGNRHYFVNLYHRDHYNEAMKNLPIVNSGVNITRIEVWLTNKTNNIENTRNIIAFTDLGEAKASNAQGNPGGYSSIEVPNNDANALYDWAANPSNPEIRGFSNAVSKLDNQTNSPGPFIQGEHYEKVQNARKLTDSEFSYNTQLGYISLNLPLNNDEVLAVAYEYTYKGKTYTVGELSTDGVAGQSALIVKLLKSTITNPKFKTWDLMMKNVYSIGAYQVSQQGFRMNFLYNNPATSLAIPFFPYPGVDDKLLVDLLDMDKINQNNQPFSDGVFDFVPINYEGNKATNGGTINTRNGRVYFSTIEPFGETLKEKLKAANIADVIINQVAFTELYDSTQIAAQQIPSKNRFSFKGEYQSSVTSDIPLNALNVPEGAVSVTAGGISLTEGVDYIVDYNLGRVKILNSGILESNTPIKVSVESNSVFGFQSKSLVGARYNYRFSENLNVGGTWMRMMERPVTQKVDIGSEPYKNNIIGTDIAFKTELPFLTKLIDMLPVLSTSEKSTLSFTGEFAHIIPGSPKAVSKVGISYIDDFEGAQSTIDLKSSSAWKLAATPQGQLDLFPEAYTKALSHTFNRSKIAWYSIDQLFYANNTYTPKHIKDDPSMLSDSRMRIVQTTEIFPNTQLAYGTPTPLFTLDLAYYPKERGIYNYDTTSTVNPDGTWMNPEDRWGGIMRSLTTNNFEQSNIQFIQFWVLDPYNVDTENQNPNSTHTGGNLYFNLGNVSEDLLPDSYKSYENGIPVNTTIVQDNIDTTIWARVSTLQPVVNAFDTDNNSVLAQDVGLDGWNSTDEVGAYSSYVNWVQNNPTLTAATKTRIISDPSNDDYTFYRNDQYDADQKNILERYKYFNNMEGNSPTPDMSRNINADGYPTAATNTPDNEDLNLDNNLSESESYFQYKISMKPNDLAVGKNYITSVQEVVVGTGTTQKIEKWYQFRVPLNEYQLKVNGIQDFRSIRFMRMFLKDFDEDVVLRFAKLELVRGEWRKYVEDLTQPGEGITPEPNSTLFDIGTVNVEENDQREPINYKVPPGIARETDPSQAVQRQLNEQSLALNLCNLKDGDARATYKNVQFDVRTYKKLKMYVHLEEADVLNYPYTNEELTLFVRLGSDFSDNYYEYEYPLNKTQFGASLPEDIWPAENEMEIVFDDLIELKKNRNKAIEGGSNSVSYIVEYSETDPKNGKRILKVKGSPNLQGLKTIMIGVRNPDKNQLNPWPNNGIDNGEAECVIVWVNELRLTDFTSEGGSAAIAQAQIKAADFANVQMSGNYSGINWGSVDSRVQERQRNEKIGVDLNTNIQLGQLFGKRARISLPFFYSHSLNLINPEYDPFNPDIKLKDYDLATRKEKAKLGQDLNERIAYNFTNVRKEAAAGSTPHFWKISNWSANYSYAQNLRKDFDTKYDRTKTWNGGLNYNYSFTNKPIEPFKNVKFMKKSNWWKIVRETNFYLSPKNIAFTNNLTRTYNERQVRNNIAPDYNFQPVYIKQFQWNRKYTLGYDLTKNLKFNFDATAQAYLLEGQGQVNKQDDPEGYTQFRDTILNQAKNGGKVMDYNHNYTFSYNVPLDKIPALDWMTANMKYSGSYNWQRAPLAQTNFGHTIQNSRNVNLTTQLNFTTLYNKVPYLKKVNNQSRNVSSARRTAVSSARPSPQKKDETPEKPESEMTKKELKEKHKQERKDKLAERRKKKEEKEIKPLGGFLANMLMTVKNVSGTYGITDGTLLPGFNQEATILGTPTGLLSPLSSFTFGQQGFSIFGRETGYDIANLAASKSNGTADSPENWLVKNEDLNKARTINHTQNISARASLEPIKDLKIELSLNRTYSTNSNDFFRWVIDPNNADPNNGQFLSQSRVETSSLSYSAISIGTSFAKSNKRNQYTSSTFDDMLSSRTAVSDHLADKNDNSVGYLGTFRDGYGGSQQEVVLGAFLTSYTNKSIDDKNINPIRNLPLPNWSINYNGLTKMKFMSKIAKNFVIRHSYSSTISVSGLQTNLKANENNSSRDINNNFESTNIMQNISISERFSPLIGFDATWNVKGQGLITKFEIKKDRNATLSLNNNQVTEIIGTEWVIGSGFKFTKVKIPINKIPASPVNIRFDLSFRDNLTVVRKIVENSNQATAGQRVVSIKSSADYNMNQNLVVQFYYDQVITNPKIATAFPTGNFNCGLRLRFNLAGVQ